MKSIKVSILGKQYPLKVEDHEEETMVRICKYVDERFQTYRNQLVKQPESTVMVLAALSIAEELFEARQNSSDMEKNEEVMMQRVNASMERLLEDMRA
ncbi:MAG: cell division protein ZapA [Balneolaceae bacterium]|nr:cell division protein ZapA [Balneolaceae bacterium]MBO6546413.1 cell division protein ZapA [Balneolaceae bacterium]MBO6648772.1 cell division protein ZapA [Balneolaceae bacterium]